MTAPIHVRGGAYSVAADFEAMQRLAHEFAQLELTLLEQGAASLSMTSNPVLAGSGALDPWGYGVVVEHLLACVARSGAAAMLVSQVAAGLGSAVLLYNAAERAIDSFLPTVAAQAEAPAGLAALLRRPGHPSEALARDPALVGLMEHLVTLPVPAWGVRRDRVVTTLVATQFDDGRPQLSSVPGPPVTDTRPPRGVADIVAGLELRNRNNAGGAVDVRILDRVDRSGMHARAAIIDITGTTQWALSRHSPVVSDLTTNLRAMADESTTYAECVLTAMREAGVTATMPVMIVGHSQGGMVAIEVARRANASRAFTVTHVVTLGSPIAGMSMPPGVQILSLENGGDVVPEADGAMNRPTSSHLTVETNRGGPTVGDRHEIAAYLQGAIDVDQCADRGVRAWFDGARGFFDASSIRTQVFHASRAP